MALGGLGVLLCGVIAIEVHDADQPVMRRSAMRGRTAIPFRSAADPLAGRAASAVRVILARPLFSRSRRPPPAAVAAAPEGPVMPRLAGIMIGPAGKSAIFAPAGGRPVIAGEGGHVDGFTVQTISADNVTVAGPGGVTLLHITFSAGKSGGAGPATAPAPDSPLAGLAGIGRTKGGIILDQGPPDLPNAATWAGPPPLSRLPVAHPPPASAPLLKAPAAGESG